MHEGTSETSSSIPSPRQLLSPYLRPDSPTLAVRRQTKRAKGCVSPPPLFLDDTPTTPVQASRPRRTKLTAEERAKKQEQRLRELTERQRWRDANRVRQRRSDTMRDLIVHLDGGFNHDGLDSLIQPLREKLLGDEASVQFSPFSQSTKKFGMIVFERRVRSKYDPIQKLWEPLDEEQVQREATCVHVTMPEQLLESIHTNSLVNQIAEAIPPEIQAATHVQKPTRHTLVIIGLDAYLRQQRSAKNRDYIESVRQRMQHAGAESRPLKLPDKEDVRCKVDHAILQLQMLHGCHVVQVPELDDAILWLHSIACDVSVRPYKLLEVRRKAPMRSGSITGRTELSTYQAMLEQIPRCAPPAIRAITQKYPTFFCLLSTLERCTLEESIDLLAPLECHSGRTTRNLGPQLARRIYETFTAEDGTSIIDS
ncbi:hypothetical protein MYAM1_003663 [Malassezia yamatoensis]|uniref:ERCC4 domain-containing protein n=1 Tax=Malassezia yamatoensis TaxID=253288 RepID=A0AAJ5YWA0_9BASI|nr:hypothetical protein MYAM1_003663 [Malassezia yamatoensis]